MKALCFAAPLTSTFKLHFQPWQRFSEHSLDVGRHFHQQPNFPACLVAGLALFTKLTVKLLRSTRGTLLCSYCTVRTTVFFPCSVFQHANILSRVFDVRHCHLLSLEIYGRTITFQTVFLAVSFLYFWRYLYERHTALLPLNSYLTVQKATHFL